MLLLLLSSRKVIRILFLCPGTFLLFLLLLLQNQHERVYSYVLYPSQARTRRTSTTITTLPRTTTIIRKTTATQQQQQQPSLLSLSSKTTRLYVGDARGDYYGESSGSFVVKEFSTYDQLEEIVKLTALPLPERPDGIVCVVKYTSIEEDNCKSTEAEYERLARNNPATLFLRCFKEYDNADVVLGIANIQVWPTIDIFYKGDRVSRLEGTGSTIAEIEQQLDRYQFQNSKLDLFTENSIKPWGSDERAKESLQATPRTTNRFIPGYDWDKSTSFFDATAEKMENDFMSQFEDWLPPNMDDD